MAFEETVADALAAALAEAGTKRLFGIPGGGSSLDVIEAAHRRGLDFVLTRTESAAAMMAAATAEIASSPGALVTGLGPGAANAVNGMAYAALDRAPVLLVSDCFDRETDSYVSHQMVDQAAMLRPFAKASVTLRAGDGRAEIRALLDLALAHPQGPVHVDLSARQAGAPAGPNAPARPKAAPAPLDPAAVAAARALLDGTRRPAILAGLQAREAAPALRALARALACPVFATYKAKGTMPENDPLAIGLTTGGSAEAACLSGADLLILFGFDPIELIAQRWRYAAPIVEIGRVAGLPHYKAPDVSLIGPLDAGAAALAGAGSAGGWSAEELARHKAEMRARLRTASSGLLAPGALVEAVMLHAPQGTRATVDAGAHMFSAMGLWQAAEPAGVLISDGLSTMGYSLPAAIASALEEPLRPVVCFTGDGGLMMTLGELATAAQHNCRLVVVVFNDSALSLIDIKQQKRQMPTRGVRYPRTDFARIAEGCGLRAWRADDPASLDRALRDAFAAGTPALVDVAVDASSYAAQLDALRG